MKDRIEEYVVCFNEKEDEYFLDSSDADLEQGKFPAIHLSSHYEEEIQCLCDCLNSDKAEIDRLAAEIDRLTVKIDKL